MEEERRKKKKGGRTAMRPCVAGDDCIAGYIAFDGGDRLVIRLPEVRLIRILARSVFLVAIVVSAPWIRAALRDGAAAAATDDDDRSSAAPILAEDEAAAYYYLPLLLRDLKRCGLVDSRRKALLLLGDIPRRRVLAFLEKNSIDPVFDPAAAPDLSIDFAFAGIDGLSSSDFGLIDRVLKVGGVLAVRPPPPRGFPHWRYRLVYARSGVVAMRKTRSAAVPPPQGPVMRRHTVLLAGGGRGRREEKELGLEPLA